MLRFLNGIVGRYLAQAPLQPTAITDLQRTNDTWIANDERGDRIEADYVVLGAGAPLPRDLDRGQRLISNLEECAQALDSDELILERHQRPLTDEELGSGRPIVIIGIGNSMATMLRRIHHYEARTGRSVPYFIVTDLPSKAVHNPSSSFLRHRPIFRNPRQGDLTGYSGDLPEDRENYFQALYRRRIVSDATRLEFDSHNHRLQIEMQHDSLTIERPHVFALVGYERDSRLLQKAGALSLSTYTNEPLIRPNDGAVWIPPFGYRSQMFAAGAYAASRENPRAAVAPGIMSQAAFLALTVAVAEHAKHAR